MKNESYEEKSCCFLGFFEKLEQKQMPSRLEFSEVSEVLRSCQDSALGLIFALLKDNNTGP